MADLVHMGLVSLNDDGNAVLNVDMLPLYPADKIQALEDARRGVIAITSTNQKSERWSLPIVDGRSNAGQYLKVLSTGCALADAMGLTAEQMARYFEVPLTSILSAWRADPKGVQLAKDLMAAGASQRQAAEAAGLSTGTVASISLAAFGVRQKSLVDPEVLAEFDAAIVAGKSPARAHFDACVEFGERAVGFTLGNARVRAHRIKKKAVAA